MRKTTAFQVAQPNPKASLLYPRTKGEVEAALAAMGFARLDILQPGLLIGPRAERRPVERFLQWAAPVWTLPCRATSAACQLAWWRAPSLR